MARCASVRLGHVPVWGSLRLGEARAAGEAWVGLWAAGGRIGWGCGGSRVFRDSGSRSGGDWDPGEVNITLGGGGCCALLRRAGRCEPTRSPAPECVWMCAPGLRAHLRERRVQCRSLRPPPLADLVWGGWPASGRAPLEGLRTRAHAPTPRRPILGAPHDAHPAAQPQAERQDTGGHGGRQLPAGQRPVSGRGGGGGAAAAMAVAAARPCWQQLAGGRREGGGARLSCSTRSEQGRMRGFGTQGQGWGRAAERQGITCMS